MGDVWNNGRLEKQVLSLGMAWRTKTYVLLLFSGMLHPSLIIWTTYDLWHHQCHSTDDVKMDIIINWRMLQLYLHSLTLIHPRRLVVSCVMKRLMMSLGRRRNIKIHNLHLCNTNTNFAWDSTCIFFGKSGRSCNIFSYILNGCSSKKGGYLCEVSKNYDNHFFLNK